MVCLQSLIAVCEEANDEGVDGCEYRECAGVKMF